MKNRIEDRTLLLRDSSSREEDEEEEAHSRTAVAISIEFVVP